MKLAPFCVDLWAKYIEYLIDASKRFQDVKEYSAGYAGIHNYIPNTCVCARTHAYALHCQQRVVVVMVWLSAVI